MKKKLLINLDNINFKNNMGVLNVAENLLENFKTKINLLGIVKNKNDLPEKYYNLFDKVIDNINKLDNEQIEEFLLHHFQTPYLEKYNLLIHDFHIFDVKWKYKDFYSRRQKLSMLLQNATTIFTEFPRTYYDIFKFFPLSCTKVYLFTCPSLISLFDSNSKKYSYKYILFPAQYQEHKNHLFIFDVFKSKKLDEFKLICTGSEFGKGEHKKYLNNYIIKNNLSNKILLLDKLDIHEYSNIFMNAELIISPSIAEGGSALIVEALVHQKKILTSNLRQVLIHNKILGVNLETFDPLNVNDCIDKILLVLNDKNFFVKNKDAIRNIENYSWEKSSNFILNKIFNNYENNNNFFVESTLL